jgi:hypothetical protein
LTDTSTTNNNIPNLILDSRGISADHRDSSERARMSNEHDGEPEWGDDDDDFTDLDKKFDNDKQIMELTGISQSYYDVGAHISPKSPLSERSFNESDLNPVERSIEQPPPPPPPTSSTPPSRSETMKSEEASETSWWDRSVVGAVILLGALSVVVLSRKNK